MLLRCTLPVLATLFVVIRAADTRSSSDEKDNEPPSSPSDNSAPVVFATAEDEADTSSLDMSMLRVGVRVLRSEAKDDVDEEVETIARAHLGHSLVNSALAESQDNAAVLKSLSDNKEMDSECGSASENKGPVKLTDAYGSQRYKFYVDEETDDTPAERTAVNALRVGLYVAPERIERDDIVQPLRVGAIVQKSTTVDSDNACLKSADKSDSGSSDNDIDVKEATRQQESESCDDSDPLAQENESSADELAVEHVNDSAEAGPSGEHYNFSGAHSPQRGLQSKRVHRAQRVGTVGQIAIVALAGIACYYLVSLRAWLSGAFTTDEMCFDNVEEAYAYARQAQGNFSHP